MNASTRIYIYVYVVYICMYENQTVRMDRIERTTKIDKMCLVGYVVYRAYINPYITLTYRAWISVVHVQRIQNTM